MEEDLKLLASRAAARAGISVSEWIRQLILKAVLDDFTSVSPRQEEGE
jgi:predicted HicB family RNase H-like nuclease